MGRPRLWDSKSKRIMLLSLGWRAFWASVLMGKAILKRDPTLKKLLFPEILILTENDDI